MVRWTGKRRRMAPRPAAWRTTLRLWGAELRSWVEALRTAEGKTAWLSFTLLFVGTAFLWVFAIEWDRLAAIAGRGGACVRSLSGEQAGVFIVLTLSSMMLSVFFVAEAVSLVVRPRGRGRPWTNWLIGLALASMLTWSLLFFALTRWCW